MREGADPTLALLSQVDPVAAAKLSANMRIKGGPTSAIQNAYAIAQMNGRTEPTKEDYLLANAPAAYSPDTIKLYDENFIYDPLTRKLTPPGGGSAEEYIEKAIKIQKDRKKEEAYATSTGTSEAEADANATAAGRRYASFTEKNGRILASVERAKDLISRFSAGFGSMLSGMPETDARALAAELTSIKSNLGFAEIQEMRLNSPTGGALGNVSTFELDGLQSTIDKLDQGLRGSELKEALQTVENHLTNLQELQRLDLQLAAGRLTPEQVEERIAPYLNHIEQGSPTDNLKQSKKSSAYWKKRARVMGARNE